MGPPFRKKTSPTRRNGSNRITVTHFQDKANKAEAVFSNPVLVITQTSQSSETTYRTTAQSFFLRRITLRCIAAALPRRLRMSGPLSSGTHPYLFSQSQSLPVKILYDFIMGDSKYMTLQNCRSSASLWMSCSRMLMH